MFLLLISVLVYLASSINFFGVSKFELPLEKEYMQAVYTPGNKVLNFLEIFGHRAQKLYRQSSIAVSLLSGKKVNILSRVEKERKVDKISDHPAPVEKELPSHPGIVLGALGDTVCEADEYSPAEDSNCTAYKPIECGFLVKSTSPGSDCNEVDKKAAPGNLCLKSRDITINFGIKCLMALGTSYPCTSSVKVCVNDPDHPDPDTNVLYINESMDIKVSVFAHNFTTMKDAGKRYTLKSQDYDFLHLNYNHGTTPESTTFPILDTLSFRVDDTAMDYVITNRLSLELTATTTSTSDKAKSIHFSPVWFFVDFPDNKLPRYRLKPLTSFQIVVIILAVFIGLVIILAVIHLIYTYYTNYKDEQEDLAKEQAQRDARRNQQEKEDATKGQEADEDEGDEEEGEGNTEDRSDENEKSKEDRDNQKEIEMEKEN